MGRYTNLVSGAEEVESTLGTSFAEHLNAEISLQTINDVGQAVQWLRTTFLYIRVRQDGEGGSKVGGCRGGRGAVRVEGSLKDCLSISK